MVKKSLLILCIGIGLVWAGGVKPQVPTEYLKPVLGDKIEAPKVADTDIFPARRASSLLTTWSPGERAGYTSYEYQANGPMGNRCMADPSNGYVHHVWMWSPPEGYTDRDIHYNVWYDGAFQLGEGVTASGPIRAGYGTVGVLPDGRAVVAFHRASGELDIRSAIAIDDAPGAGTFSTVKDIDTETIPAENDSNPIWPYIAISPNGTIHVIAQPTQADSGEPGYHDEWHHKLFYARSTDLGETFEPWTPIVDWLSPLTYDIAVSRGTQKVGVVYETAPEGEKEDLIFVDINLIESEDGGATWGNPKRITEYKSIWPDTSPHAMGFFRNSCIVYDNKDQPHVAFLEFVVSERSETTFAWYPYLMDRILHWSPNTGFSVVSGTGSFEEDTMMFWGRAHPDETGTLVEWTMPIGVARPELVAGNGDTLYCVFTGVHNINDYSFWGFMNGDLYVTMSPDGGKTWGTFDSLGRGEFVPNAWHNITNSPSPQAMEGECQDDRYASACPYLYDNVIHIQYIEDKDAAPYVIYIDYTTMTNNPVLYLKVPVGEITANRHSIIGIAQSPIKHPKHLTLSETPNPFGYRTTISYSLPDKTYVNLRVYDATGRVVDDIVNTEKDAGVYTVTWNGRDDEGRNLPNGIYFCRIEASGKSLTRKLVLVR